MRTRLNPLQTYTLLYLGLPVLIWLLGWIHWTISIPFLMLFSIRKFDFNFRFRIDRRFMVLFTLSTLFLILLGYGEFLPQSGDWSKHNAIFRELFDQWMKPVMLALEDGKVYHLNYGLGFYMVPSFIAGLFDSVALIPTLVLIQTTFGLMLTGCWIKKCFNIPEWTVLVVLLIGRIDYISELSWLLQEPMSTLDRFWKLGINQFLSSADQTPQHSLPAFLCLLACYDQAKNRNGHFPYLFLLITFAIGWSPFILFSLLPLIIFLHHFNFQKSIIFKSIPLILLTALLFIALLSYYSLHIEVSKINLTVSTLKAVLARFILRDSFIHILLASIILSYNRRFRFFEPFTIHLMLAGILFSMVYQFIGYGYFNDFAGKTVFLSLFFVNILILATLKRAYIHSNKWFWIFLLAIHIWIPMKIVSMHLVSAMSEKYKDQFQHNTYALRSNLDKSLEDVLKAPSNRFQYPFIDQYIGYNSVMFNRVIKKRYRLPRQ